MRECGRQVAGLIPRKYGRVFTVINCSVHSDADDLWTGTSRLRYAFEKTKWPIRTRTDTDQGN